MNLMVAPKRNKFDSFKVKLHSDIYNENLQNGFEMIEKDIEIKSTQQRIKQLKDLKKQLEQNDQKERKSKYFKVKI